MKIAILGGSFNPVHIGHLCLADAVLASGYDRIILVPAFKSPFKAGAGGASAAERLEMLSASIAGDSRLTIDDCEIKREGISYTIDTIAYIKEQYLPRGKPGLVLGEDLLDTFHLWHNASSIAEEADLIVARRLAEQEQESTNSSIKNEFPYPHKKLENQLINISSRQLRDKIKTGLDWRYLVPEGARHIIEDRKLYGYKEKDKAKNQSKTASSIENIHETTALLENVVRRILSASRFIHSRNTALLTRDLCIRFGLDPKAGYLAGITHDMCKTMSDDEFLACAENDGLGINALEKKKPSLLHGRAAAIILKTRYNINDEAILEAVRYHVTGGAAAGPLAKILYIADKIEVSRDYVDHSLREMSLYADLDDLFFAVLNNTVDYLNSSHLEIAEETQKLLSNAKTRPRAGNAGASSK